MPSTDQPRWGGPEKDISGLRIVVADDDQRMRQFYVVVLASLGHEVVGTASNGHELVEQCLNEEEVDLVITDIKMPGLDGIGAAHVITERVALPFLFVSAYHDETLIREASMSCSYGYLVKPIKQEDLATSIPIAIRRFRDR